MSFGRRKSGGAPTKPPAADPAPAPAPAKAESPAAPAPGSSAPAPAPASAPSRRGGSRGSMPAETLPMRIVATAGIVGIGVAVGAIFVGQHIAGWVTGLVVSVVTMVLMTVVWGTGRS